MAASLADNPFAHPSTLPYQLPPFDRIKDSDYRAAFDAGMREQRAEVHRIVQTAEAPDFQNTIVALERLRPVPRPGLDRSFSI